jgi:hypothetical protein
VTESVHGRLAAPQQEVCCGTEACRPRHNHPWFHQKGTYWCCVPSDMATHLPPAARKCWGQALCLGCCHFTVPALEVQSHACLCNRQCMLGWQHLSRRFAAARMRAGPDTTTPGETRRASASVMCHLTWRLTTTWPQGCVGGRHCVWLLLYASISSRRLSLMQVGLCIRQCMLD